MKLLTTRPGTRLPSLGKGAIPFFLAIFAGGIISLHQAYAMDRVAQSNRQVAPQQQIEVAQITMVPQDAPLSPNALANQRGAASGFATPGLPVYQAHMGTVLWDEITPAPAASQLTNQSINTGAGEGR